ncbi:hypothetical protein OA410_02765 [Paracoccaceae bacterium]|nr:hypothetical protein [Paracoccaceae bacterium]
MEFDEEHESNGQTDVRRSLNTIETNTDESKDTLLELSENQQKIVYNTSRLVDTVADDPLMGKSMSDNVNELASSVANLRLMVWWGGILQTILFGLILWRIW